MNVSKLIGSVGQWVACCATSFGIVIELTQHAHIGWVCITAGSLIFAVATKIKYYLKERWS